MRHQSLRHRGGWEHPVFAGAPRRTCAVFSEVELEEFCGDSAEARLQDLAWLGPRVCRHEAVIEEVMSQAPVLPARFATLFTSIDSLKRSVHEHREAIAGFFAGLGDQQEWAVKGLLDRTGRTEKLGLVGSAHGGRAGARRIPRRAILPGEADQGAVGTGFQPSVERVLPAGSGGAGGVRRRISGNAKYWRRCAAETDAEVVLNWAFLVSPAALDDFRARLERLNGGEAFPGLKLTLTGPWPPYSFVPDLSDGAEA